MAARTTSIASHGVIESKASETYGTGDVLFRIGNGGAGATGLIEALSNAYLEVNHRSGSIEWVCNHSRNTQLALLNNYVDLALTYERDQESTAIREGWSTDAGCIFHDHFCVAGPPGDPANIRAASSLQDAFAKIAEKQALFHSRADNSATMWKERSIWSQVNHAPWDNADASTWYKKSTYGPADALTNADRSGAYLLTDRSTLLRQTSLGTIHELTVFFEPASPEDQLMNSCHALTSPFTTDPVSHQVDEFLAYVRSAQGQAVIAAFGSETVGFPLFSPVDEGFARSKLAGGRPQAGAWVKR